MATETSLEDIFVWPCDTWCYRHEKHEYTWMSDDYQIIPYNTPEWDKFHSTHSAF